MAAKARQSKSGTWGRAIWLGVAKKIINPKPGLRLFGYPAERPNTGTESDLFVRAAVFAGRADRPEAVLCVIDNLYAPSTLVAAVRAAAAERVPGLRARTVMVAATHTHSAPNLIRYQSHRPGEGSVAVDAVYRRCVINSLVEAIEEAWERRRPVTARHGVARAALGHNRRVIEGQYARNEWQDPRRTHTGYFNPDIPFTAFHDEQDKVYAMIAGYGCHPVALGPDNLQVSADYPGYFVRELERRTGAEVAIQVMTGAADINPLRCLGASPVEAKRLARNLAAAVLPVLREAECLPLSPVVSRTTPLRFALRRNIGRGPRDIIRRRGNGSFLQTEVQSITIGQLMFVSAPGELFSEIALRVRNSSQARATYLVEHANDAVGYIFTDEAALQGGYEVCRGSIAESMEGPYFAAAMKVARPRRARRV